MPNHITPRVHVQTFLKPRTENYVKKKRLISITIIQQFWHTYMHIYIYVYIHYTRGNFKHKCTLEELDTLYRAWVELLSYINATGETWVCMYIGINIVSMCITFWGSPRHHDNGWVPLRPNRKNPHRQRGFKHTYMLNTQHYSNMRVDERVCLSVFPWQAEGFQTYMHAQEPPKVWFFKTFECLCLSV